MRSRCRRMAYVLLCGALLWPSFSTAQEGVAPFGFRIGKMAYEAVVDQIRERGWRFAEFEKRQLTRLNPDDPQRGKSTFLMVKSLKMDGIRNFLLFFSRKSTLDAMMISLEPKLFDAVVARLDREYEPVSRDLSGKSPANPYPYVQWRSGDVLIELQRNSPNRVRLVYVPEVLYENYKDFLEKRYEPFRAREEQREWMDEL